MVSLDLPGGVDVRRVWTALDGRIAPTVLVASERLDRALGHELRVTLALEVFQHTGSFKFRAALAAALGSHAPRLLTASSGNFGAALALAAARTGKQCTVVMPDRSANVKIAAVRGYGASVDLVDTEQKTRAARLAELAAADPEAESISPYDDPRVVAGNSTLGREILEQVPAQDCVVVPVGGGGLASGVVLARDLLGASCSVVGAEPVLANDAARSLREGTVCVNDREPPTLCDGARTLSLGKLNYSILSSGLAGIVEVEEQNISRAVRMLFEAANVKAEPTGALALAALLQDPARFAGKRAVCIVSGGNVDSALYTRLIAGMV
ncbi:MAG: pyridoxal-phosphate dependent enzyme [Candidatus Wallbacteria bacterium]|nr:pyridoxal-phosphate dependent enzyme [Candidatus Wallbacteria bacterium]